jgi:hypothetical protein
MSSQPQAQNGLRRVVGPVAVGRGNLNLFRIIPIWIASAAIHGLLLAAAFFVFSALDVQAGGGEQAVPDVTPTTEVEEAQKEIDLTNTDIGEDDSIRLNYNLDRIEDVSVPGPVDPTAAPGIVNAPEDAVRTNVPPPPGSGMGTGGAPVLPDAPAIGSLAGTLGGMGGSNFLGAFSGRTGATREKMLAEGGGNKVSEAAVARGLEWLALHQGADGHWGLRDFNRCAREKPYMRATAAKVFACNCDGAVPRTNDIAATGFALLPFLAAGITHKATSAKNAQKDYTHSVEAGLNFLMHRQDRDGSYASTDMYSHGIATIAVCEAYGLSSDPRLKASAQRAINFIVAAQDTTGGGWRYGPRPSGGDTSVTGWELMALKSGQMAGLNVPRPTINLCERFLDSVESTVKGRYSYQPGNEATPPMTAVALLCRQYLGVNPRNPGLIAGVDYLKKYPPGSTSNIYYEYYATQVFHHMGGESWQFWNQGANGKPGIRDYLIARQDHNRGSKQHIEGSFPVGADAWGAEGGRIMTTSLSILCLEVYYRHLPLYRRDLGIQK